MESKVLPSLAPVRESNVLPPLADLGLYSGQKNENIARQAVRRLNMTLEEWMHIEMYGTDIVRPPSRDESRRSAENISKKHPEGSSDPTALKPKAGSRTSIDYLINSTSDRETTPRPSSSHIQGDREQVGQPVEPCEEQRHRRQPSPYSQAGQLFKLSTEQHLRHLRPSSQGDYQQAGQLVEPCEAERYRQQLIRSRDIYGHQQAGQPVEPCEERRHRRQSPPSHCDYQQAGQPVEPYEGRRHRRQPTLTLKTDERTMPPVPITSPNYILSCENREQRERPRLRPGSSGAGYGYAVFGSPAFPRTHFPPLLSDGNTMPHLPRPANYNFVGPPHAREGVEGHSALTALIGPPPPRRTSEDSRDGIRRYHTRYEYDSSPHGPPVDYSERPRPEPQPSSAGHYQPAHRPAAEYENSKREQWGARPSPPYLEYPPSPPPVSYPEEHRQHRVSSREPPFSQPDPGPYHQGSRQPVTGYWEVPHLAPPPETRYLRETDLPRAEYRGATHHRAPDYPWTGYRPTPHAQHTQYHARRGVYPLPPPESINEDGRSQQTCAPNPQYVEHWFAQARSPVPYHRAAVDQRRRDHTPLPVDTYFQDRNVQPSPVKPRKRRGNLPKETTAILSAWFKSHLNHPYPQEAEKQEFARITGLTPAQISNWFINARRRQLPVLMKDANAEHALRAQIAQQQQSVERDGQDPALRNTTPLSERRADSPDSGPRHSADRGSV
ncbi:hypothetical protein QBC47DRAFT_183511 [Echria macrotheca]|uniref:Homeobox domain-containing protein n=1 Tax=Echria macrotheca TaxID=438768 RepID=A0AAJ0BDH3_9PEZI|nr:hypothetical protein QBC47DRAFT_183511 [Echria macrotheca]